MGLEIGGYLECNPCFTSSWDGSKISSRSLPLHTEERLSRDSAGSVCISENTSGSCSDTKLWNATVTGTLNSPFTVAVFIPLSACHCPFDAAELHHAMLQKRANWFSFEPELVLMWTSSSSECLLCCALPLYLQILGSSWYHRFLPQYLW